MLRGGVVFEVNGKHETVLHAFTGSAYGGDGDSPVGGLVRDHNGNLFGTTESGGNPGGGLLSVLPLAVKKRSYTTSLGGADGGEPRHLSDGVSCGESLRHDVRRRRWCAHIFHVWGRLRTEPKGVGNCLLTFDGTDGGWTSADVLRDAAGNLYGTTPQAGPYADGVAFKISATRPRSRERTPDSATRIGRWLDGGRLR